MRNFWFVLFILMVSFSLAACSEVEATTGAEADLFIVSKVKGDTGVVHFDIYQHRPTGCQYTSVNGGDGDLSPLYTAEGLPYCVD